MGNREGKLGAVQAFLVSPAMASWCRKNFSDMLRLLPIMTHQWFSHDCLKS